MDDALRGLSWPGIELRHLMALRAVARERSFGRAALRLGYTQSAISQQISALERAVGLRLLERQSGRGEVALTEAGRIVLAHADAVARELAATKASLDALDRLDPVVRVGVHATTGAQALPAILLQMGSQALGRVETCEHADDRRLLDLLEHDELDAAFVQLPVAGQLAVAELLQEEYVVVVSARYATSLPARVGVEELARQRPLLLRSSGLGDGLEECFESDDPLLLCRMAAGRHGAALLPRSLVPDDPAVCVKELRDPPTRRLGLVWKADVVQRSPLLARFVEATVASFPRRLELATAS